jgi:transcriptional regulator with XRE-family HTH domain
MNFSRALKRTMLEFDITGIDLAQKSGISKNTISTFRQGGQTTTETLEKLLAAMPAEAREFFFHELEQGDYSQSLTSV